MRIKNLTPFLTGYKVTSRTPPKPEMTLVVRASFTLRPGEPVAVPEGLSAQGTLTSEVYREDDEERRGECLYPGDFADIKPRADVLFHGACHAPGGKPITECPVRFAVGAWSKMLRVLGTRAWSGRGSGAAMSKPLPFTRMPIDYAHAFGGPGHAPNPVGKGVGNDELPNIEHAGDILRSRDDRPSPAGFGPLNPSWPERKSKVGKDYGARWRQKQAPFYAEDFDWSFFNAAPADQQIEGYLRGDEEIAFQNLHPKAEIFSARLPGIRMRAFVNDIEKRFREVPLVLDTLLADLENERLFLTWRGVDAVKDIELRDVQTVLVASERMSDPSLAVDHYRGLLDAAERDPLEVDERLPEDQRPLARAILYGERKDDGKAGEALDPVSAAMKDKLGSSAQPEQHKVRQAIAGMIAAAPPNVDLAAALAVAVNDTGAPAKPRSGGGLRGLQSTLERLKSESAQRGEAPHPAFEKLDDPRLASVGFSKAPPEEPGPGRDLSGQDLSGQDLRGRDLRGANLSRAILVGTNLENANLAGANLSMAILHDADLTRADLSGADLTTANLGQARARGADFRGATLDRAIFQSAVLVEANLGAAKGAQTIFAGADMTKVSAREARFTTGLFSKATLREADFTGAHLARCAFLNANLEQAIFTTAALDDTTFGGSDLTQAIFTEAHGEGTIWLGATLDRTDFAYASLPRSFFIDAKAANARFFRTNLAESRFYRASLHRAAFVQASLFRADLNRADLTEANLQGANLFEAKLYEAITTSCNFAGANMARSLVEPARRE